MVLTETGSRRVSTGPSISQWRLRIGCASWRKGSRRLRGRRLDIAGRELEYPPASAHYCRRRGGWAGLSRRLQGEDV